MNERWWSHESDTDLLTPGGDKGRDLANSFLELHRQGETACMATAGASIPDRGTLAASLIAMRTAYAPKLADAVSKSVDTMSYANLLVADLADDAEQAAMDVFGTLTGKGIPAAEAAKRTGLVYGIPKHSLGGYITKAAELKTPMPVLTEQADRLLFGYSQVIAEVENEPVEIEKRYNPNEPRNVRGEFARVAERDVDSAIGQTKPRVSIDDLLAQVKDPAQEKTPVRERATGRATAVSRESAATREQAATPQKDRRRLLPTRRRTRKSPERKMDARSRMSPERIAQVLPKSLSRTTGKDEAFKATTAFPELPSSDPVTFSLSDTEFASLGKHYTADRTIKLGTIERTSGRPGLYGTSKDEDEHLRNLGEDARTSYSPGPDQFEIGARRFQETSKYHGSDTLGQQRMRQDQAEQLVDDTLRDEGLEFHGSVTARRNEWRQVQFIPLVGGDGLAMVYRPSSQFVTDEDGNPFTASTPSINEIRISDHALRGIEHEGRHSGLELDPNQRIAMGHFSQADAHFDLDTNTEIRTWHVTTDRHDEIGKAYDPMELRNKQGRWSATAERETQVVEPTPRVDIDELLTREKTVTREQAPNRERAVGRETSVARERMVSRERLEPAERIRTRSRDRQRTRNTPVRLTGRARQAFRTEVARLQQTSTDLAVRPLIQGHSEVSVLHAGEMSQVLAVLRDSDQGYLHVRDFLEDAGQVQGNDLNDNIGWLVSHPAMDPDLDDDADHEMRYYVDGRVGTPVPGGSIHIQEHEPSALEAEQMARALHDQIRKDPSIVHAWYVDDGRDPHDDFGRRYYTMLAAHDDRAPRLDGDVLHIVVHDYSGKGPVGTITQLGQRRRWQDVPKGHIVGAKSQRYDGTPDEVSNPVVQLWTVHHPKSTL